MGKVDGQCEVPLRLPLRSRNHLTYRNPAAFPEVTSSVSNHLNRIKTSCPHLPLSVCCKNSTSSPQKLSICHRYNSYIITPSKINGWRLERWADSTYMEDNQTDVMISTHREPIQILRDRVCCTLRGCLNCTVGKQEQKWLKQIIFMMFGWVNCSRM